MAVTPLKSRTRTLEDMHRQTLRLIRLCKKQFRRMPHEGGLSDEEFIEQHLTRFENEIIADRHMLKMIAEQQS